ncbi:MAG: cytochrome P450 [Cytophagales bacterium]
MESKEKYSYPAQLSFFQIFFRTESLLKNPIPFHKQAFEKYGDTFSIRYGYKSRIILSRDNEVALHILQKKHKNYQKSIIQTDYLSKYIGKGLLSVNGDFWLRQRRLIQPAFHKEKLNVLTNQMREVIDQELTELPVDQPLDVFPLMNKLAFTVVAKSLFQLSASAEMLFRIKYIIEKIQEFLVKEIRVPYKSWWFKLSGQVEHHRLLAEENRAIIKKIIQDRQLSKETHDDLLQMLLDTRYEDTGEPMTLNQLIDEITIIFIAGHETTANALTFTLHLLGMYPEVQEKIADEIKHIEKQQLPLTEQLQNFTYVNAVINESMRLYPPAWITDRVSLQADTVAGFRVRKETIIGVSFYALHRNPKYWENPDDFKPERFLGEQRKRSMNYFYPFGAGPRMCIGMGFAMYEMTLAIVHLLKHYQVVSKHKEIAINPLITLKPKVEKIIMLKR